MAKEKWSIEEIKQFLADAKARKLISRGDTVVVEWFIEQLEDFTEED